MTDRDDTTYCFAHAHHKINRQEREAEGYDRTVSAGETIQRKFGEAASADVS